MHLHVYCLPWWAVNFPQTRPHNKMYASKDIKTCITCKFIACFRFVHSAPVIKTAKACHDLGPNTTFLAFEIWACAYQRKAKTLWDVENNADVQQCPVKTLNLTISYLRVHVPKPSPSLEDTHTSESVVCCGGCEDLVNHQMILHVFDKQWSVQTADTTKANMVCHHGVFNHLQLYFFSRGMRATPMKFLKHKIYLDGWIIIITGHSVCTNLYISFKRVL